MCQILLTTYFPLIFQLITSSLGIPALMTNGGVLACANLLDANICTCTSGWQQGSHTCTIRTRFPHAERTGDLISAKPAQVLP